MPNKVNCTTGHPRRKNNNNNKNKIDRTLLWQCSTEYINKDAIANDDRWRDYTPHRATTDRGHRGPTQPLFVVNLVKLHLTALKFLLQPQQKYDLTLCGELRFHSFPEERWLYYQLSAFHLYIFLLEGWENVLFPLQRPWPEDQSSESSGDETDKAVCHQVSQNWELPILYLMDRLSCEVVCFYIPSHIQLQNVVISMLQIDRFYVVAVSRFWKLVESAWLL